ncbi:hypothetical protein IGI04_042882, partial [Brassica rapa subsp. trilocularis]
MVRANVLVSLKTSRQAFHGQIRSRESARKSKTVAGRMEQVARPAQRSNWESAHLSWMDCSCFGPMVRVRAGGRPWGSGHEAMDRLGMGQGRGLSPEGLGKALGLCPTQTHAVLAKGRMRPRG